MAEKDTTGAGITLDRLTAWWDRTFPEQDMDVVEWGRRFVSFYLHEQILLEHLRSVRKIAIGYLRPALDEVISRQEVLLRKLTAQMEIMAVPIPEAPSIREPVAGLPLSFDLHEIHDMYNAYVHAESIAGPSDLKTVMSDLVREKKHQEDQLSEIATKLHS